jgi:D-arabinose 5-phosphate isomerase GutQ
MSEVLSYPRKINSELEEVLEAINAHELDSFLDATEGAGKIALYGVGREGLMNAGFCAAISPRI